MIFIILFVLLPCQSKNPKHFRNAYWKYFSDMAKFLVVFLHFRADEIELYGICLKDRFYE